MNKEVGFVCFDRIAHFYDKTRAISSDARNFFVGEVARVCGLDSSSKILDVGTGTGRIISGFSSQSIGGTQVGIDISKAMLRKAREKLGSQGGIRLVLGDARQLPFPSNSFNMAFTSHILHLIGGWEDVLREIVRILVPSGFYVDSMIYNTAKNDIWSSSYEKHLQNCEFDRRATSPGVRDSKTKEKFLESLGLSFLTEKNAKFPGKISLRFLIGAISNRVYSSQWDVPERIHKEAVDYAWSQFNENGDKETLDEHLEVFVSIRVYQAP